MKYVIDLAESCLYFEFLINGRLINVPFSSEGKIGNLIIGKRQKKSWKADSLISELKQVIYFDYSRFLVSLQTLKFLSRLPLSPDFEDLILRWQNIFRRFAYKREFGIHTCSSPNLDVDSYLDPKIRDLLNDFEFSFSAKELPLTFLADELKDIPVTIKQIAEPMYSDIFCSIVIKFLNKNLHRFLMYKLPLSNRNKTYWSIEKPLGDVWEVTDSEGEDTTISTNIDSISQVTLANFTQEVSAITVEDFLANKIRLEYTHNSLLIKHLKSFIKVIGVEKFTPVQEKKKSALVGTLTINAFDGVSQFSNNEVAIYGRDFSISFTDFSNFVGSDALSQNERDCKLLRIDSQDFTHYDHNLKGVLYDNFDNYYDSIRELEIPLNVSFLSEETVMNSMEKFAYNTLQRASRNKSKLVPFGRKSLYVKFSENTVTTYILIIFSYIDYEEHRIESNILQKKIDLDSAVSSVKKIQENTLNLQGGISIEFKHHFNARARECNQSKFSSSFYKMITLQNPCLLHLP